MAKPIRNALAMISMVAMAAMSFAADNTPKTAASRAFTLTYSATVTGLSPGQAARIWLPVAQSSADQDVTIVSQPSGAQINSEPVHNNQILYVDGKADGDGKIPLSLTYKVVRREVIEDTTDRSNQSEGDAFYLKPDNRVPVGGKAMTLIADKQLPQDQIALARLLYDTVDAHMIYSKPKDKPGWGNGDSNWACDSGFGNCTDFHSLFISLARAENIPAKFEIGFSIPEKHGEGEISGYHCWAFFKPQDRGWIPVDISEASKHPEMKEYYFGHLTADRITFTTGRDLTLVPKQDGAALNYFVYPYVEVVGKPYTKIEKKFTFNDTEPK
ncbi:MAG TPA: transglutaminase-like domain-containing protein [Tepidisphaeraceae bacterium]|nr:transglutaminase-like domain-containing protein [Tepidisphaeraceae bacterium]